MNYSLYTILTISMFVIANSYAQIDKDFDHLSITNRELVYEVTNKRGKVKDNYSVFLEKLFSNQMDVYVSDKSNGLYKLGSKVFINDFSLKLVGTNIGLGKEIRAKFKASSEFITEVTYPRKFVKGALLKNFSGEVKLDIGELEFAGVMEYSSYNRRVLNDPEDMINTPIGEKLFYTIAMDIIYEVKSSLMNFGFEYKIEEDFVPSWGIPIETRVYNKNNVLKSRIKLMQIREPEKSPCLDGFGPFEIIGDNKFVCKTRDSLLAIYKEKTVGFPLLQEVNKRNGSYWRIEIKSSNEFKYESNSVSDDVIYVFWEWPGPVSCNSLSDGKEWKKSGNKIYLYHEICHYWLEKIVECKRPLTIFSDPYHEWAATGLGKFYNLKFNENKYRNALGKPLRPCYEENSSKTYLEKINKKEYCGL